MVDTPLSSFMIHIKVLKIVVKVDGTGTQVSTEQRGVGGKDGGHVDVSFSTERDG